MFKTGLGVIKTKGTGTGKEAYTEKREGSSRIEGLIVFADETELSLSEKTHLSKDSVRGRISELEGLHGYKILKKKK